MGLVEVGRGRVVFDGRDITRMSPRERAHAGLGYVPQTRDIFASLSVEENLVAGLKGRPRRHVDEAYALFPRLAERRGHGGAQLSGGEQQMLTIAPHAARPATPAAARRAARGSRADHLPRADGDLRAPRVRDRRRHLLVEQKVDDALRFATDAVLLERGEVVFHDRSAALQAQPSLLERYVGVAGAH